MFENPHTYKKIVSCLGIVGYLEEDIKKRGTKTNKNLPLNCLYVCPNKDSSKLNPFIYQMMFPDNNHQIPCPKFFSITLTNQDDIHSYLYCLKFSEKYSLSNDKDQKTEIDIPIVIYIKSEKEDLECFKQLLNIINYIIVNDDLEKDGYLNYMNINDYKKVQLMNLFYFLFSLPHTSPHSQVKLKINKEITNSPIDSIDFYFCSNCEIPCNKNDTDINILFLLLDQSIIIKALFAILTEKQIVFRASQAYLLHIIIPTFLKLIFPFKWWHRCITVLPKESLDLLEAPGSFIFGVLSNLISLKDLMTEYPGKIVIDCDTNEIFGDSYLEPYEPPKIIINNNQSDEKKNKKDKNKKDKDNKDNKDILNNVNVGNCIVQGNNIVNVGGSYLYKYESNPNIKKKKINFEEKNNIIIDTQKSQLLIDKTDIFIDSREMKWLRRNIQLVRNPEIFEIENINNKKNKKSGGVYLSEEDEENIVLPNRSFSYNIQNIFMKFLINKLSYSESEFMQMFKNTNLFLKYKEPEIYQNNSGKIIVSNILELKNQQRTFDNCFNIEYTLHKFHAETMINRIDEKLNENNNINEKIQDIYDKIKTILNNYNQFGNEEDVENLNNYDGICESDRNERKSNLKEKEYIGRKTEMKKNFGRLTRTFTKGHERNKTSVLQETITGNTNFLLMGADNSSKGVFKFYNDNGFLEFIKIFENFLDEDKIDIKNELYEQKIYEQILNIILKSEDIFPQNSTNNTLDSSSTNNSINNNSISNTNIKNDLKKKDTITDKNKKNNLLMSIIPEKEEEENEIYDGRETVIQKNVGGDYDFASNFMNNMNIGLHLNLDGINDNKFNDGELDKYIIVDEDIITFPNFNEEKENNENNINEKEKEELQQKEEVNLKSQYYLFVALILEDILENKEKSDEIIQEIKNNKNVDTDIQSLILKLYRLSYKYSGKKHRDFPYFSYYNYLTSLDLEELEILKGKFNDLTNMEIELYQILGNVIIEKLKKVKKKPKGGKEGKNISPDKKTEENKKKKIHLFQDVTNKIKDKISPEKKNEKELLELKPINMNEILDKNETLKISDISQISSQNENPKTNDTNEISNEFNSLISYAINTTSEFDCNNENSDWKLIILLAKEINSIIPLKKDIYKNSIQTFLDDAHQKLMENKKIFNLIGQLKYVDPSKIKLLKERMCFWLNCFNYLILFTFFYKKWNIAEKDWKFFFKNVKYYIGDNYYSFHDMLYMLYKKILFFPSSYKNNDNLKKYRVNKAEDSKSAEKKYPLLYNPFNIYIPIKGFLRPIIFDEGQIEKQFNQRIKEYFFNFIIVDYQKNIILPELLINYIPNFLDKEYKKFQPFFENAVFEFIKEKKFKTCIQKNFEWKLDFDKLFDNINQEN